MGRIRRFLVSLAVMLWASEAAACLVCFDLPQNTVTDHVPADRLVVLAKVDASDPFRFYVAEVLRGEPFKVGPGQRFFSPMNRTERRRTKAAGTAGASS